MNFFAVTLVGNIQNMKVILTIFLSTSSAKTSNMKIQAVISFAFILILRVYNNLTFTSSSFSLNIGNPCLCSSRDFFSFLPYEAFCPPEICFFHSGRSWGIWPTPRMFAASCRPSAVTETNYSSPLKWHQRFTTDKNSILTLNAPIATKVVCCSCLLKCLRSLYGKQCGPRSDCSCLFWVHAVCFYI